MCEITPFVYIKNDLQIYIMHFMFLLHITLKFNFQKSGHFEA